MISCILGGFGDNRNVQAASNDCSNISERNSLFSNPVKPSPRSSLLKCQPKKIGSIESVHSGPAIEPVAHICRNAFFTCNPDESWNEAVIAVAVDGWRKTHHRYTHSPRRHRGCCFFRCNTGKVGGGGCRHAFLGRKATWRNERSPRGDDQGAIRAGERSAESFNGASR